MNTYVFYPPPFEKTAKVFNRKHAVQQMYRAIQIYRQINNPASVWRNIPAVIQWEQWPNALAKYIAAFAKVLGIKPIQQEYTKKAGKRVQYPPWCKNPQFLNWYRGNLKEAFPFTYGKLWEGIKPVEEPCHPIRSRPIKIKAKPKLVIFEDKPKKNTITIKGTDNPPEIELGGTKNAIDTSDLLESIKSVKELIAAAKTVC